MKVFLERFRILHGPSCGCCEGFDTVSCRMNTWVQIETSWGLKLGVTKAYVVCVPQKPCVGIRSWLAQLLASGKMSSDAENNYLGRQSGALYTSSAVEHPRSSFRAAHVPSRTIGTMSVQCLELSCTSKED